MTTQTFEYSREPVSLAPGVTFRGSSEAMVEFMAKYAEAMSELEHIGRDREGQEGNRRFQYMTFASLSRTLRPILAKHGFTFLTPVSGSEADGVLSVSLIIMRGCKAGPAILTTTCALTVADRLTESSPMQAFGKVCSYARRYVATYGFGIEADNDPPPNSEDIETKDDSRRPKAGRAEPPKKPAGKFTKQQAELMAAELTRLGMGEADDRVKLAIMQTYAGLHRVSELNAELGAVLINSLKLVKTREELEAAIAPKLAPAPSETAQ